MVTKTSKGKAGSIARPIREQLKPESLALARMVLDTPGLDSSLYQHAIKVLKICIAKQGRNTHQLSHEKVWDLIDFVVVRMRAGKSLRAAAIEASEYCEPKNFFPLSARQIENIYKVTPQAKKK